MIINAAVSRRGIVIPIFALACALVLTGCEGNTDGGFIVSRAASPESWPYAGIDSGKVRCEPRSHQITIELNGKKYGLNGKAQGAGGFEPSQNLASIDEDGIINLPPTEWIERGLALCDY